MSLRRIGYVELPPNQKNGGFDHAAVHTKSGTIYVAHTANDSLDLIDSRHDKYLRSITNLAGVAGALVSNERDLVFASNRGDKTVGIFRHDQDHKLRKVQVGGFPNGLAFDPSLGHLIAANVAKQDDPTTVTASIVDVEKMSLIADVLVPGRTRWTVFDKWAGQFYINISKPSQIVAINSRDPHSITTVYEIPATGPHGLDLDSTGRRLFCACDDGGLFTVQLNSRKVASGSPLSGAPDVIFYNEKKRHLYVAIGNPGVIDVVDTEKMLLVQTVKTELGAHTIAYNPESDKIYAFLPETHRASVYKDE